MVFDKLSIESVAEVDSAVVTSAVLYTGHILGGGGRGVLNGLIKI